MNFHPYSEIFQLIEGTEFDALVEDIKTHGLREKIWVYQGKILDGRNRFLACKKANVRSLTRVFKGSDADALAFVRSANVHRRHLNETQRAMAASRYKEIASANLHSEDAGDVTTVAAEALNVSRRSVFSADKVREKGSKKLQTAVERGEIAVSKAASVVDLPKSEQLAAATKKPEPAKLDDVMLTPDWTPEIPDDEELAAIDREIQESESRILRADDTATGYHDEIKRQAAEIATLKITRDGYMNGKAAITKLLIAEQRKVTKLEKEIEKLRNENEGLRERVSIMEAA